MQQPIDSVLAERGQRYGEFNSHAYLTQNIKEAMKESEGWDKLDPDMAECLEMIAHKVGRILNGDPHYVDSWTDIIGYTRLVEKRLLSAVTVPASEPESMSIFERFADDFFKRTSFVEKSPLTSIAEALAAQAQTQSKVPEPSDKELADKLRGLPPGMHVIFVDEESGEV